MKEKLLVIGGGITGLVIAYSAKKAGYNITLLEKTNETGGNIKSFHKNNFLSENGPNSLLLKSKKIFNFFKEIGLDSEIIEANPYAKERFIVKNAKPEFAPRSPLTFLTSKVISPQAKFRMCLEPFIPKGIDPNETLSSFVTRRLGMEFLDYLINPLVSGVYAGSPDKLSIKYAFSKLHQLEQNHGSLTKGSFSYLFKRDPDTLLTSKLISFKSGMQALPNRLSSILKDNITCNSQIKSIQKNQNLWNVEWNNKIDTFDKICLCIPSYELEKLPFDSELKHLLTFGKNCIYPPVATITLGFSKESIHHKLNGFGMLVPEKENLPILGTLFSSSLFNHRSPEGYATLTTFIGGRRSPTLAQKDPNELIDITCKNLKNLIGASAKPVFSHVIQHSQAIPQYEDNHSAILNSIADIENKYKNLHILGNFRSGISVTKCLENSLSFFE